MRKLCASFNLQLEPTILLPVLSYQCCNMGGKGMGGMLLHSQMYQHLYVHLERVTVMRPSCFALQSGLSSIRTVQYMGVLRPHLHRRLR